MNFNLISYFLFSFGIASHILFYTIKTRYENQTEGLVMKSLLVHLSNPLVFSLEETL